MKELKNILKQYKKIEFTPSIEDERAEMYQYVYATNKLEGNQLTLSQTTQLLKSDTISGEHIKTSDVLEQKGMYKALSRMLKAVREKEKLSVKLLLELNWLTLSYLWKYDDAYINAKSKGQKEGEFKISKNKIQITKADKVIKEIIPLSEPNNANKNMQHLVETINNSNKNVLEKAVFIAQEIWLHQPFVDGNKRTGRLLINFLTMQEGFPLFSFNLENSNYNSLLVEQYIDGKKDLVLNYITAQLIEKMQTEIHKNKKTKKDNNGFRMLL